MSDKLLPCPFCGSTDLIDRDFHYEDDGYYEIGCKSCNGAREVFCGVHAEDRPEAVRQWNTRAPQSPAPAPSALQPEWQPIKNAPRDRRIEVRYLTDDPRPVQWMATDHDVGWHLANGFGAVPIEFDPTEWRDMVARAAAIAAEPVSIDLMQRVWFNLYFDEEEAGNTFQHTLNEVVDWLAAHNALPDEAAPTTSPEPARTTATIGRECTFPDCKCIDGPPCPNRATPQSPGNAAAVQEALEASTRLLDGAQSGYISGSPSDMDFDTRRDDQIRENIAALSSAPVAGALQLGDIVEMHPDAPNAAEWAGTTMKVVSLRVEPNGSRWISVIEGNPRHRGNGFYDGETDCIEEDHLQRVVMARNERGGVR